MYRPDARRVQRLLQEQYGYPEKIAERVASDPAPLHDDFAPAIEAWLDGKELPPVTVEGITLPEVMRRRRCNPLAAARMMDPLLDPDLAPAEREDILQMLRTPVRLR